MKRRIGSVIQKARNNKRYKTSRLCNDILSTSQLYRIESGEMMPAADKLINMLTRLNMHYDEFILSFDGTYPKAKIVTEQQLIEAIEHHDISKLRKISKQASAYHDQYDGIYFKHVQLIADAIATSTDDMNMARKQIQPIQEYLFNVEIWTYYEVNLFHHCLFMFNIEIASLFGNKVLQHIELNYSLSQNTNIACASLVKLSIRLLDYSDHCFLSLKYAEIAKKLAYNSHNASQTIYIEIIYQIIYFKLNNRKFDRDYLFSLMNTFKLLNWSTEFQYVQELIHKHGIKLQSSHSI